MEKSWHSLRLFFVLLFSTAFIFSSTHYGAQAFERFSGSEEIFAAGTFIESFDVTGKNGDGTFQYLNEQHDDWLKNAKMLIQYREKTVAVDLRIFDFQLNDSVLAIENGKKNQIFVHLAEDQVKAIINSLSSELKTEQVDITQLAAAMKDSASALVNGEAVFKLRDFLIVQSDNDEIIADSFLMTTSIPSDFVEVEESFTQIIIPAKSSFSMLEFVNEQKLINLSSSTLSKLASGIYKTILPTNFQIVERNIGQEPPESAELGFEAKIDLEKHYDLHFFNPNPSTYILKLRWDSEGLKVSLKGEPFLYKYVVSTQDQKQFKPKIIKQYSPFLNTGQKTVKQQGRDGSLIKMYREIYENEKLQDRVLISEDFYLPIPRVEIYPLVIVGKPDPNATPIEEESHQPGKDSGVNNELPWSEDEVEDANMQTPDQDSSETSEPGYEDDLWGKPNEQPK